MSIEKSVNSILTAMHKQAATDKGGTGEQAVLCLCEDFYKQGGILIHSYEYKTVDGLAGNIKKKDSGLYLENTGSFTEIDILLVTRFKIFPIEVKSYRANKITVTNKEILGCRHTDKSPIHQNEMHCRHLYPHIFSVIPDGSTKYIEPIVVFVDKAKVIDERTSDNRNYIHLTILNKFRELILSLNTPVDNTLLDLYAIDKALRGKMYSSEKYYPIREE